MIGEINKKTPVSDYQPSAEIRDFTAVIKKDYAEGELILNKPYIELNDRSVIQDENRGQLMFNAFVDTGVEDPNEAWKWRGTRSMARNKGIAMHANLTGNFLLPMFTAQNEDDEVDQDFSEIMRDIIEWMASPTNSNYQSSFLQAVFGMLTNPVTYIGAEYSEVFQTIREMQKDGSISKKEILDEVLSGFQAPIYSSTQILITNAYERNIQKQRRIIKRRFVEKSELEAKYGTHPNWVFLKEGIKSIYNEENGLFYDVRDHNNSSQANLIAEETPLCRRDDSEVCFLNGIYFGNENIENNPIRHRDNRNAPKYNVVPFGFHRIGEHFFYYKSMMNSMGWDNMLYDTMSEIVMNRALLEVDMPIAVSGSDKIDSEIIFPNSVVAFEDKDTKIVPLLPNSNMVAGFNALRETEKSINEGSVNETISGQLPDANQKAYNVAQAQSSARKLITAVGKSLAESITMLGDLMKDIAINNITVAEVEDLIGDEMKLKYKTFFLPNKSTGGKVVNKSIKFNPDLIGAEMSQDQLEEAHIALYEKTKKSGKTDDIRHVNPELFAKFKYLSRTDAEEMFTKNQEYWQPILLNLKTTLAQDPYTNQEALTKKIMYSYFQSAGGDFVQKAPAPPPGGPPGADMMPGAPAIPGMPTMPQRSPLSTPPSYKVLG